MSDHADAVACKRCRGTGKEPDRRAVGAAIRSARLDAGMSLRSVARELGMSAPYLSDIELGKRGTDGEVGSRVTEFFNINPHEVQT